MTAATGMAMQMQLQLKALMHPRGYAAKPCFVPLAAPVDYPIDVEGLASTTGID